MIKDGKGVEIINTDYWKCTILNSKSFETTWKGSFEP